ncbi:hypothetical protein [Flocculibacter collagenilyticus]|uniref:hypothetical protein n=1 Tax=Flocculibacter collagenilyticus TaxID=2744479 RepID=UPI0018F55CE7|nr:hypothetical protein [Flocculibacter collagenilyticus]
MRKLILILVFALSACATKVTSLNSDADKALTEDMGFLLIGVQTNQDLKSILISGPQNIELSSQDIKKGTNYILIDLEVGQYTIDKLQLDNYWRLFLDDEEHWQFSVKSGQINYVGHLEVVKHGFWNPITAVELVNRSSESLEFLESSFPTILANRELIYGGPGQDRFFNFLKSQKKD